MTSQAPSAQRLDSGRITGNPDGTRKQGNVRIGDHPEATSFLDPPAFSGTDPARLTKTVDRSGWGVESPSGAVISALNSSAGYFLTSY